MPPICIVIVLSCFTIVEFYELPRWMLKVEHYWYTHAALRNEWVRSQPRSTWLCELDKRKAISSSSSSSFSAFSQSELALPDSQGATRYGRREHHDAVCLYLLALTRKKPLQQDTWDVFLRKSPIRGPVLAQFFQSLLSAFNGQHFERVKLLLGHIVNRTPYATIQHALSLGNSEEGYEFLTTAQTNRRFWAFWRSLFDRGGPWTTGYIGECDEFLLENHEVQWDLNAPKKTIPREKQGWRGL